RPTRHARPLDQPSLRTHESTAPGLLGAGGEGAARADLDADIADRAHLLDAMHFAAALGVTRAELIREWRATRLAREVRRAGRPQGQTAHRAPVAVGRRQTRERDGGTIARVADVRVARVRIAGGVPELVAVDIEVREDRARLRADHRDPRGEEGAAGLPPRSRGHHQNVLL